MKKLIYFANELDRFGEISLASELDAIIAMQPQEQSEIDKADVMAIKLMEEALQKGDIPKHLAEQMKVWIKSRKIH